MKRRTFTKTISAAGIGGMMAPGLAMDLATGPTEEKSYLCVFSKHMQWLDFKDMAVLAKELGFTGIDLTVRPNGHIEPAQASEKLPMAVEAIREQGMEVPMITTSILDPDAEHSEDVLRTAGGLGIKVYRTGWFRYRGEQPVRRTLTEGNRKLLKLQELNEKHNIRAGYQNHSGNFAGSSLWDLLILLEGTDPYWMGVQFDIRHAIVEGPDTWMFVLEELAPYINSLDIKDFAWFKTEKGWKVNNVPLGEGMVDFGQYFRVMDKLGIRADYSLHLEYPLGGAEHGSRNPDITRDEFSNLVLKDIRFIKNYIHI